MTGNVVFLAFAVVGAHGFSIPASVVALVSFGLGSVLGGRIIRRFGDHRGRHVAVATASQALLLAVAMVLALVGSQPFGSGIRYTLIVALGGAMGVQNSSVRRLAVPDLTTTVLTLTVTGSGPTVCSAAARDPRRAGVWSPSPPCSSAHWRARR